MVDHCEVFVVSSTAAKYTVTQDDYASNSSCLKKCLRKSASAKAKCGSFAVAFITFILTILLGAAVAVVVLVCIGHFETKNIDFFSTTKTVTEGHKKDVSVAWKVTESLKTIDYVYEIDDFGNESLVTIHEKKKDFPKTTESASFCGRSGKFQCLDGRCIDKSKKCNGRRDCSRAEDEKGCSCVDYLNRTKICDRYLDCENGQDEIGCDYACPKSQYQCAVNGKCIDWLKLCDGKSDCSDGADEKNCWFLTQKLNFSAKQAVSRSFYVDSGYLFANKNGVLAPICSDGWNSDFSQILCNHLGYRHTSRHWVARLSFYRQLSRNPEEKIRKIDRVILHPGYRSTPLDINDLALIRMNESVNFGPYLRPPCLPEDESDFPESGERCTVIGWGFRNEKGRLLVDSLQSVRLRVIDSSQCNASRPFHGNIIDGHLCLSDGARKMDACQGDSGGALLCDRGNGPQYLAGITSTGFGCARPHVPGIWTKLAKYIHWVKTTLQKVDKSETNSVRVGARYPCNGFQCRLGDCIYSWLQCDGQKDCLTDGSDEDNC